MAQLSSEAAHARSRIARASRAKSRDEAEIINGKRDYAAARIGDYITKIVAGAPPLSRDQIDRLRALLEPARRDLISGPDAAA
jgi:hypothetical protein